MFDRFTERARKVMTLARQEAQKLRNDYIGTEHILLGLLQEGSGVASHVLKNLGVDLQRARGEMDCLIEPGTSPVSPQRSGVRRVLESVLGGRGRNSGEGQLPFTPRAKRVLELALEEAANLGHNYIGTEHLLLGLVREEDGPAAHVLRNLGIRTERIREQIVELLGDDPPPGNDAVGPARAGWESVIASPVLDWAAVSRARLRAEELVAREFPWADSRVFFDLRPGTGGWTYLMSVSLVPSRGALQDAITVTVPGGPLQSVEKDVPGLVESLVRSIEREDGGTGPDAGSTG
jgi:hypothetical protein